MPHGSEKPLVLIAGGSSAAGIATASALLGAGMRVLTVGSDADRIRAAADAAGPAVVPLVCDLADPVDVARLAEVVHRDFGPLDGLIQLVGGWRGGKGIAGQSDEDWDVLHRNVLTTLRNTSRAFYADLDDSAAGRLVIVSSTSVTAPTAGNANYAAAKAAAEAWTQAVGQGFASGTGRGAAVVLVVKALVDDGMRAASPERSFPGFTGVAHLADTIVGLFTQPADAVNGARIDLS
ncbi:SDR family NAD(P)-dependent oxidoreductase [Arthrobacter sp. 35W]|uniref:SDR family NAD(P)-dependent oxidoreductase n=1 Tax=Arthrobacter sp. 35W TaxID=1132441 RepID=UPI000416EE6C|nr:SDR family NAD(P)-dependent oxidoreductase [Arthrobacter sp. 35W]